MARKHNSKQYVLGTTKIQLDNVKKVSLCPRGTYILVLVLSHSVVPDSL